MPVRLALLGAGIFAETAHLPSIKQNTDAVELVAVYSRSRSSAEKLAKKAGDLLAGAPEVFSDEDPSGPNLDTLLAREDVDAVLIALPITKQPAIILKCLSAGKHVLSEKPVAPDVTTAAQLVSEYRSRYSPKLVWQVAEQFVFEPAHIEAANAIKHGDIGRVTSFDVCRISHVALGSKYHATSWRNVPDYQGGFLLDGGVHVASLVRMTVGPIVSVSSRKALVQDHLRPHDTIQAVMETQEGAMGVFKLVFGSSPTYTKAGATIIGTDGHIELTSGPPSPSGAPTQIVKIVQVGKPEVVKSFVNAGIEAELAHFARSVAAGPAALDDVARPEAAFEDLALIEACLNSGGALLKVPKLS